MTSAKRKEQGGEDPHLRDFFAGLAMLGMLSAGKSATAQEAYDMADAMLEVRKETTDANPIQD